MTEAQLQSAIIETASYCGWMPLRLNSGTAWSRTGAYPIKLAPAGTPDLLLIGPGGRLVFVEVKTLKGRLRPAQAEMHAQLRGMGHTVIVARSLDDLVDTLGLLV